MRLSPFHRARQRGVSLIEALVAFAVMAFGMLAVVGMQSTLRGNGDLARQRAEALRIAQDYMEEWRGFSVLLPKANRMSYAAITSVVPPCATCDIPGINATYTLTRQVIPENVLNNMIAPQGMTVAVVVDWKDRTNTSQSVRLSSYIAGVEPELSASIMTETNKLDRVTVSGRSPYIPQDAVRIPGGSSAWVPPGQNNPNGNVAWKFDNLDGRITLCIVRNGLSTVDVGQNPNELDCAQLNLKAYFFGGYVGYSGAVAPPSPNIHFELSSPNDISPLVFYPGCFVEPLVNGGISRYLCAVPVDNSSNDKWSGFLRFDPAGNAPLPPFPLDLLPALPAPPYFKVCRYVDANGNPPVDYVDIAQPLDNQNFVIVTDAIPCPAGTVPHQPR